ncbi:hypothetical protein ACSX0U_05665 [Enterococcus hirae]|uniref:hypothetical protein n=1 Tax=Enterococcus hirae TaxID=1354 RepID=UPI001CBE2E7E|nr:hypothetical protein [Enterococcus hirae]MBZ3647664.1 hypothetical protein [Enterococcus hirae]
MSKLVMDPLQKQMTYSNPCYSKTGQDSFDGCSKNYPVARSFEFASADANAPLVCYYWYLLLEYDTSHQSDSWY